MPGAGGGEWECVFHGGSFSLERWKSSGDDGAGCLHNSVNVVKLTAT